MLGNLVAVLPVGVLVLGCGGWKHGGQNPPPPDPPPPGWEWDHGILAFREVPANGQEFGRVHVGGHNGQAVERWAAHDGMGFPLPLPPKFRVVRTGPLEGSPCEVGSEGRAPVDFGGKVGPDPEVVCAGPPVAPAFPPGAYKVVEVVEGVPQGPTRAIFGIHAEGHEFWLHEADRRFTPGTFGPSGVGSEFEITRIGDAVPYPCGSEGMQLFVGQYAGHIVPTMGQSNYVKMTPFECGP